MPSTPESSRRWRQLNPEKTAASALKYRREHPEQVKARTTAWQKANPDKVRASWLRASFKKRFKKYGVTVEWFRDQLVGQAGRCGICWRVFRSARDTHIDHDHVTSRVRGLICADCNRLLGMAKDSSAILLNAAKYLSGEPLCLPEKKP